MENKVWSSFTRKIFINAPAEQIYWHWATAKGMESWILRSCEFVDERQIKRGHEELTQPGDEYQWYWHNQFEGVTGKMLEGNGRNYLVFTFMNSEVMIKLDDEAHEKTLVSLTQRFIPTDDESKMNICFVQGTAWSFWLTNLKAYIEHDITLHETEALTLQGDEKSEFINI